MNAPSVFHHVTRPSIFSIYLHTSSAGTALLAALDQPYWQRWNSSTGTALLAALEQLYWQRWNSPTNSAGTASIRSAWSRKVLDGKPQIIYYLISTRRYSLRGSAPTPGGL
jgi:hypothetical protein